MMITSLRRLTLCITGEIVGGTRADWHAAIRAAGGYHTENVTSTTNILVVGNKPGKGKQKAAAKWGVPQMTAREFLRLVSQVDAALPVDDEQNKVELARLEDELAALKALA